ncbi:hypothetical protein ACWGJX_40220 [Streptomyces sp. NPDC054775]
MKPARAEELYFDPELDLFMLTSRELVNAVRTALRAVRLAVRLRQRAEDDEQTELAAVQTQFCRCPRRIP